MELELRTVVEIILGVFGCAAWTIGVIKYLVDRMDKQHNDLHLRMSERIKREEFDKHVDQLRTEIKDSQRSFTKSIDRLGNTLGTRLDSLMLALGKNDNDKS